MALKSRQRWPRRDKITLREIFFLPWSVFVIVTFHINYSGCLRRSILPHIIILMKFGILRFLAGGFLQLFNNIYYFTWDELINNILMSIQCTNSSSFQILHIISSFFIFLCHLFFNKKHLSNNRPYNSIQKSWLFFFALFG